MDLDSLSSWMQTCWGCTPFSSLSGSGMLARALARGDSPFTLGAGVSRVGAVINFVSRRCSETLSHLHNHIGCVLANMFAYSHTSDTKTQGAWIAGCAHTRLLSGAGCCSANSRAWLDSAIEHDCLHTSCRDSRLILLHGTCQLQGLVIQPACLKSMSDSQWSSASHCPSCWPCQMSAPEWHTIQSSPSRSTSASCGHAHSKSHGPSGH